MASRTDDALCHTFIFQLATGGSQNVQCTTSIWWYRQNKRLQCYNICWLEGYHVVAASLIYQFRIFNVLSWLVALLHCCKVIWYFLQRWQFFYFCLSARLLCSEHVLKLQSHWQNVAILLDPSIFCSTVRRVRIVIFGPPSSTYYCWVPMLTSETVHLSLPV